MRLTFPGADVDAAHRWMEEDVWSSGHTDRETDGGGWTDPVRTDRAAALTEMNESPARRVSGNTRSGAAGVADTPPPVSGLLPLRAAAAPPPEGGQRPLVAGGENARSGLACKNHI